MYDIKEVNIIKLSNNEWLIQFQALRDTKCIFRGDLIDPPEYGPEPYYGAVIIDRDPVLEDVEDLIEENKDFINWYTDYLILS
jgi:hypothetical protein